MLLNGDVGEVDEHVVQFTNVEIIAHGAEPTEAQTIPTQSRAKTVAKTTLPRLENLHSDIHTYSYTQTTHVCK